MKKRTVILGGGTFSHVRSHFALAAPAFGTTANDLESMCKNHSDKLDVQTIFTKMADPFSDIVTNEDVDKMIDELIADASVKIIFFTMAMCDFDADLREYSPSEAPDYAWQSKPTGKHAGRLKTREGEGKYRIELKPSPKVINKIRKTRKDIFLVGFKTTCDATEQEQYLAGLKLCKEASCNLVFANDVKTRVNMVITPEEASYHVTKNRAEALAGLVEMTYLRSHLTFTRSTVIAGEAVAWDSPLVPKTLRKVVDHCIERKAYKPFNGATVGHFATKLDDTTFLTSKRKTNFNDLYTLGLVKIKTDGPDSVVAYGAKPSVGGQSQRIVFSEHKNCDCIVHFHCPLKEKPRDIIPIMSQREFECGSHECGQNTSNGLARYAPREPENMPEGTMRLIVEDQCWYAVMLDKHGPNIVFNKNADPDEIIDFIEANFDLGSKTGGYSISQ